MYLKSLKIRGFKSFAERTEMQFEPGLTAVVGPNGSGKSNITDAILWVLGEQSPTSLRGSSMEDIIFAGGPNRQALGLAEVTICFDNVDKALPIEYSEVSISRRVSRSGESGYYINSAPCRLMDIQDLLSDSGVGREMHTIISQGRIDQVLNSRPEEIRMMIEESAGLLKYRKRKEKALRRLERLEQDLLRLGDIEKELRKQLKPLREQADRAGAHKEMAASLKELEVGLAVEELHGLQERWQQSTSESKESDHLKRRIEKYIEELSQRLSGLKTEAQQASSESEAARSRKFELERIQEQVQSMLTVIEERSRMYAEKADSAEQLKHQRLDYEQAAQSKVKEFEVQNDRVQKEYEELQLQIELIDKVIEETRSRGAELSVKVRKAEESIAIIQSDLHRVNREHIQIQAELTESQSQQAILRSREKAIISRVAEYEKQIEDKQANQQEAMASTDELLEEISGCEAAKNSCPGLKKAEGLKKVWVRVGESEIGGLINLHNRWTEQMKKVTGKLKDIDQQALDLQQKKNSLAENIKGLEAEIADTRLMIETALNDRGSLEKEKDNKEKQRQEMLVKAASLRERVTSVKEQLANARETGPASFGSAITADEPALLRQKAVIAEQLIERIKLIKENTGRMLNRCGQNSGNRVVEFTEYQKQIDALNREGMDTNSLLSEIREHVHELELEQSQLQLKVSTIVQRIVEDYEIPIEHAVKDYELKTERAHAIEAIKSLKRKIAALGPINPIAIEEYAALEQRYDILAEQTGDIKKSRRDLRKIIDEIDRRIESTFQDTFDVVNQHFNEIIGYLFDGGYGKLILLEPENLLSSGVEIEVKPGKKKTQKLTLLSGGERSLAALALLFALYETRPSPFYILDEVEAALDDINLQRFVSLLDKYRKRTQFLIVTHQKRTMEMADALYGVSMKQDGTSRLISQIIDRRSSNDEVSLAWEG